MNLIIFLIVQTGESLASPAALNFYHGRGSEA